MCGHFIPPTFNKSNYYHCFMFGSYLMPLKRSTLPIWGLKTQVPDPSFFVCLVLMLVSVKLIKSPRGHSERLYVLGWLHWISLTLNSLKISKLSLPPMPRWTWLDFFGRRTLPRVLKCRNSRYEWSVGQTVIFHGFNLSFPLLCSIFCGVFLTCAFKQFHHFSDHAPSVRCIINQKGMTLLQ